MKKDEKEKSIEYEWQVKRDHQTKKARSKKCMDFIMDAYHHFPTVIAYVF